MKRFYYLFFIILVTQTAVAQNQNSIWCFGDSAGVNFIDTSAPVPFFSAMDGRGSCTNISDSTGQLLFYAFTRANLAGNSGLVFNKQNTIMDFGGSIVGEAWYQEMVITPMPGNANKYYLFSYGVNFSQFGLFYSIIDMNQNGGLGKVTSRNIKLADLELFDGITAVKHGNGRDWWLIFKLSGNGPGPNNAFYTYLISPQGISPPSIQSIGSLVSNDAGYLSLSKEGDKLLLCSWANLLELFNFDRCTGHLSNPKIIEPENSQPDGKFSCCCFSPNGDIAFVTSTLAGSNFENSYLLQYNLKAANIAASKDTIQSFVQPAIVDGLKIGPDNKVYVSTAYNCSDFSCTYPYPDSIRNTINENLSVINSPDSLGTACDFQPFSFYLGGKRTYYGLPNNPDYEMGPWVGSVCDTLTDVNELMVENLPLSVYPNPFYNKITLQPVNASAERIVVNVFSNVGEIVFAKQSVFQLQEIDLSDLANGVYLLQIKTTKNSFQRKIVKL